jgi:hypothetical protein
VAAPLEEQAQGPLADFHLALDAALRDPDGFISGLPVPAVIDEIQRAPDLMRALKRSIDRNRKPGQYLLTGSANIMALPSVTETLAGKRLVKTPKLYFSESGMAVHFSGLDDWMTIEKQGFSGPMLESWVACELCKILPLLRKLPGTVRCFIKDRGPDPQDAPLHSSSAALLTLFAGVHTAFGGWALRPGEKAWETVFSR